jgi:hypothetical protein
MPAQLRLLRRWRARDGRMGYWGASGLAVDSASKLYIADSGNRRVRQVQPAGGRLHNL